MSFPPQLAVPDLVEASKDADILVFVIPHQFIGKVCDTMSGKIKKDAIGISLIKVQTPFFHHREMLICILCYTRNQVKLGLNQFYVSWKINV